jgi:hypothetical protein
VYLNYKKIDNSGGLNWLVIAVVGVVALNLQGLVSGIGVLISALLEYRNYAEIVVSMYENLSTRKIFRVYISENGV